jgi:hypothetical protein
MWDETLKGNLYQNKIKNKKKNGNLYWQRVSIQPYKSSGIITQFIASITDYKE